MTILSIVQNASKRVGLDAPASVIGNAAGNVVRMLALANEEGRSLLDRHRWQSVVKEATFTTVGTTSQGTLATLTGVSDIGSILNDTLWNRDSNTPVYPIDAIGWQQMLASTTTGPYPRWRLRGNTVLMYPTPTAGETIAFEYKSKNWCESSGGDGQTAWAADTDVGILDEGLMEEGLVWRWKSAMGFGYGEDFRRYEQLVANAIARDRPRRRITLGSGSGVRFLGQRSVAEGGWTFS